MEQEILESLQDDAMSAELNDGRAEIMRAKNSQLVVTRPNYTVPEDDDLAAIPIDHDFAPDCGIAALPERKKVVSEFIRMAASPQMRQVFEIG